MEQIKKILKNRVVRVLLVIVICLGGLKLYTNYVVRQYNNSSPKKAIAEYINKTDDTFETFFMGVEDVTSSYDEVTEGCRYYQVKRNMILGYAGNMTGTFEVKKVDDSYYVSDYNNMPVKQ